MVLAWCRWRGAMPVVLCPNRLRGERTLMGSAQPHRAWLPDCKGDPESDKGREKPEPAGVTHQIDNV